MSILQEADKIIENETKKVLEIKYLSEMDRLKHINRVLNRSSEEQPKNEGDGYEDLYNRINTYLKIIKNLPIKISVTSKECLLKK